MSNVPMLGRLGTAVASLLTTRKCVCMVAMFPPPPPPPPHPARPKQNKKTDNSPIRYNLGPDNILVTNNSQSGIEPADPALRALRSRLIRVWLALDKFQPQPATNSSRKKKLRYA